MKKFLLLFCSSITLLILSFLVQKPNHDSWVPAESYSGPLHSIRHAFLENLNGVSNDAKALVAGLAIGDKSLLSSATSDVMKTVSLTHLTAVSGANCAIVIGSIFLVLGRFTISRWLRLTIALGSLLLYILLVGPQASVLRASLMTSLLLVSKTLGRNTSAISVLGISVVILLIIDPWLAVDYGFALSVLATTGILMLAPLLIEKLSTRIPVWLAISISVSASAQLLCLPILLQLQPGIATYSLVANVLAEPLVAPITVLGMLACIVVPFIPLLASWLSWVASLGAWLIISLANILAEAPASTLSWPDGPFGTLLLSAFVLVFILRITSDSKKVQRLTSIVLSACLCLMLASCTIIQFRATKWPDKNWTVVSCDVGQGDGTVIRSQNAVAVIDVGREPKPIRQCLRSLGISHIDLLVLTHFDMDHVGGLDGALEAASVDTALITSYQDERPAAAITYRNLRKSSHRLISAGVGLSGKLGRFDWQVLSPHQGAPEAEDSNDGSVTMLFRSANLYILTLADLGEKGQMRLARESSSWLGSGFGVVPLVVKVSHHGSADQYPELYEELKPDVALVSVGAHNDYGHPTRRTLDLLERVGAHTYRTDLLGGIAVSVTSEGLRVTSQGRG